MNPMIDYLVRRRFEQRMSVRKVAKRAGLTRTEVREVEHGDPTVRALAAYAHAVGEQVELRAEPIHRCPSLFDLILTAAEFRRASTEESS
ncbi:helix-turn-helix domain-containing protein [Nocardioides jensenii]|uniref:helix-turn-helix domain-containing protein n=1 Tax=Nocardioides jensenii TaxID=1843 RepID=UPI00082F68AC|nr:transcriptional regulator [Nocardioides jensenii]